MRTPARRVVDLLAAAAALALALSVTSAATTRERVSAERLLAGSLDGVAVASDGRLFRAPKLARFELASGPDLPAYAWDTEPDGVGGLFVATGPRGQVLRVGPSGKAQIVFSVEEPLVTALLRLPDGDVLAASAPGGRIYRFDPDGRGALWTETGERYVWSLAVDGDGRVHAATGERGLLLRLDATGAATTLFDADDAHLSALAPIPTGGWLVGTANGGIVYQLDAQGRALVLLDDALPEVRAVDTLADGRVVVALLAPPAPPERKPAVRIELPVAAGMAGASTPTADLEERPGPLLEGTIEGLPEDESRRERPLRGKVVVIGPDGYDTVWTSAEEAPYALRVDRGGRAVFGTGEPARLYALDDSGTVARLAELPEGQLSTFSRRGDSLVAVTSNPSVGYRIDWDHDEPGVFLSPVFDAGVPARWGGISWRATGPAGTVEMYTRTGNRGDPDATWSGWSPAHTDPRHAPIDAPDGRFFQWRARVLSSPQRNSGLRDVRFSFDRYNRAPVVHDVQWEDGAFRYDVSDPDGDPLDVRAEVRRPGADAAWRIAGRESLDRAEPNARRTGTVRWNVDTVDEASYETRLTVTDAPGVPAGEERSAHAVLADPVRVDRTPPEISVVVEGNSTTLTASDATSPIAIAQVVAEGRAVRGLRPDDGVADERRETFTVAGPIDPGTIVRVTDAAGNAAEATLGPED